ncbi:ferredoxin--NADP reductase [Robiginitalea sp. SC105]|uniref:ferredoxin--NADP reductase n=1 Tax=Robiginitalea sp. SC105 TaxID=2762332 RepID=UPI00163A0352|nr:ferredoxin--NADP reductase [Robiginitalea sp. SC105]MBC2838254.1 ferredoxin--NADP reductase [Robiginitalea sp. SC105]
MSDFHSLKVSRIDRLTPESVAVSLEIPTALRDTFDFKAGQYITVRSEKTGRENHRAYSISSIPGLPELTIGIKQVKGGKFSEFANETLKAGDVLEVMPPQGRFIYEKGGTGKNLIAFAAGSGITPVMSILQTALESDPEGKAVLVYGNRSREETMFLEKIRELQEKYADRFVLHDIYSRSRYDETLFGRIEKSTVNFITKNKHRDLQFDRYYICGPEPMIRAVEETLLENGAAREQVFHELFTTSGEEDPLSQELEGMTRLKVVLDDETHELTMDRKGVVLDAVLAAKIDAPYSCQGGICSTCIARIREGNAKMAKNQILTDSEIEEGLILTCQAHPTSGELTVDYDDV